MWTKAKKIFLFIVANIVLVFAHTQAFQSPVPWLVWLSVAVHAYVLMYLFFATFFPHKKQSKNESL